MASTVSVPESVIRQTQVNCLPSYGSIKEIEDITRWREDMNFMFEWQTNCPFYSFQILSFTNTEIQSEKYKIPGAKDKVKNTKYPVPRI